MTTASCNRARYVLLGIALVPLLMGCSNSLPPPLPTNPLPACPETPNCERISKGYAVPADSLYQATTQALEALRPHSRSLRADSFEASAVYRVGLLFKDDVDLAVRPQDHGSVLHLRSASRVGHWDLGVNRRRVQRLLFEVNRGVE